eukprot:gene60602-82906_t
MAEADGEGPRTKGWGPTKSLEDMKGGNDWGGDRRGAHGGYGIYGRVGGVGSAWSGVDGEARREGGERLRERGKRKRGGGLGLSWAGGRVSSGGMKFSLWLLAWFVAVPVWAAEKAEAGKAREVLAVVADHADALYRRGETVTFTVTLA